MVHGVRRQQSRAHHANRDDHRIPGADSRQQSVENALNTLSADTDLVAIHDAVRPFIDLAIIQKVIEEAAETGAESQKWLRHRR